MRIERHPQKRGVYRLSSDLEIDRPIDEVFEFFATARNLELITPEWIRFQVVTPEPIDMRPGLLIDYLLRVRGIPLTWQSEITEWEPPYRFVDEQRKGPYRMWHHEHTFKKRDGSTLVGDRVEYCVPGDSLIHRLFVRRDLEAIFRFRSQKLAEIFQVVPQST